MNILEKYELSFYEYSFLNSKKKGCESKQVRIHHTLGIYISQLQDTAEVDDELEAINKVLNNSWPSASGCPNDMIMSLTEPMATKFSDVMGNPPDFNNPDYSMPTVDFRDILIEWRVFLGK